eukprot:TRINITY_DN34940_c0_g1_i1.p1 TRINITY_DN34940_c0_g1~~TRINITY_DN34940_c0_g1_i1.p1  ORF type:complete len:394 (-),score=66.31 TRINITY_DN34940_c0_g1_i1:217-1398(-)
MPKRKAGADIGSSCFACSDETPSLELEGEVTAWYPGCTGGYGHICRTLPPSTPGAFHRIEHFVFREAELELPVGTCQPCSLRGKHVRFAFGGKDACGRWVATCLSFKEAGIDGDVDARPVHEICKGDGSSVATKTGSKKVKRNGAGVDVSPSAESLQQEVQLALDSQDLFQLPQLLADLCGVIAAPRAADNQRDEDAMDEAAKERLRAQTQHRLRKLLNCGLRALDLSDAGTAAILRPALTIVYSLICDFEKRTAMLVDQAKDGKQWALLKEFASTLLGVDTGPQKVKRQRTERAGADLSKIMVEALKLLGGEGTAEDVVRKIKSEPHLWRRIESKGNLNKSGRGKQGKLMQDAWASNIQTNLCRYAVRSRKTSGDHRKPRTIWKLRDDDSVH